MEQLLSGFNSFTNALPGALSQGLIWGIMAIGLFITYKLLNLSDLTVDGSFCTGGAVCVMTMLAGHNVWVAMLVATLAGMIAGAVTGFFQALINYMGFTEGLCACYEEPEEVKAIMEWHNSINLEIAKNIIKEVNFDDHQRKNQGATQKSQPYAGSTCRRA